MFPPPGARAEGPRRQGGDDFNRERQLHHFRCANGLCFKCGDKYSREHQCKRSTQLLTIEICDFGEVLSDEAVRALDLLDVKPEEAACCQLFVNPLAGTEAPKTIKLRTMVGNQVVLLLVGSGSTHSFVTASFAARAGCQLTPTEAIAVRVAIGAQLQSNVIARQLSWWTQGHTFETGMGVLELGAYDAVLGMDWLEHYSTML